MSNTVLVLGSGGREHALAWKLAQSEQVKQVIVAPGNGGTSWQASDSLAACESAPIAVSDFAALIELAQSRHIALTVVGPELPLAEGIVDAFESAGLRVFGPDKAAAQLEASKAFARAFMDEFDIPSPIHGTFTDADSAKNFIREFGRPVVVKASGLAAGKGVLICETITEAEAAVDSILADRAFGAAGDQVVIEEMLSGDEFSVLAFCDGKTALPMMVARDHKRALDNDEGLNTGGMGAFAPTPDISTQELQSISDTVLQAAIDGIQKRGTAYKGVLYAGLMRTEDGLKVLEFNCRFGDPETQVVLPMLASDLYSIMNACIDETLDRIAVEWHSGSCATVVLAAPGYPEAYPRGLPITIENPHPETIIFHAGTKLQDGTLVSSGGRVLNVTARAASLNSALKQVYADIAEQIHFDAMHYRHDIGGKYRE